MITIEQAQEELTHWTFWPGTVLSVFEQLTAGNWVLDITVPVLDSNNQAEVVTVGRSLIISSPHSVEHFRYYIEMVVTAFMQHEQNEALRRDGVCWVEPHP